MLESVKLALRIKTDAFDDELNELIQAAYIDLGIAGVSTTTAAEKDPILSLAVKTFCRMHFGQPDDYDRLKRSYDEQKAQLSMSSAYTDYSMLEGSKDGSQ